MPTDKTFFVFKDSVNNNSFISYMNLVLALTCITHNNDINISNDQLNLPKPSIKIMMKPADQDTHCFSSAQLNHINPFVF